MTEHNSATDLMTGFEAAAATLAQSLAEMADKRVADHDEQLSALEAEARGLAATIEEAREAAAAHDAAARDLAIVEERLGRKRRALREETEKQTRLSDPKSQAMLKRCAPAQVAAVKDGNAAAIERCNKAIAKLEPVVAALRERLAYAVADAERFAAASAGLAKTKAAIATEREERRRAAARRSELAVNVERHVAMIRKKAHWLRASES